MKYKAAVFIGRFQPFHLGHHHVVKEVLKSASKLIICVGGADGARRPRNPWTFRERAEMIRASLSDIENGRTEVVPIADCVYNEAAWLEGVQQAVRFHAQCKPADVALAGRKKDRSSYYLSLFPQWGEIAVPPAFEQDATTIREDLFLTSMIPAGTVPNAVTDYLVSWMGTSEAKAMRAEYDYVAKYKRDNDSGPYHRNNACSDAVVIQAGHILMVRRKALPGKGKLALPGGHIERDETALDGCMRELREETGIKVPPPVLRASIERQHVFDDPWRSDLCRTYSHAFYIVLRNEGAKLAKLRAGSDAESAMWVPLADLQPDQIFDDHYHIIRYFTGGGIDRA